MPMNNRLLRPYGATVAVDPPPPDPDTATQITAENDNVLLSEDSAELITE